jgi:PKD repeat protein
MEKIYKSAPLLLLLGFLLNFIACEKKNVDPTPDFSYEMTGSGVVKFINNSSNAISYEWDFGDNSSLSNEVNPVHTYKINGEYTVKLTIKKDGNQYVASKKIAVSDAIKPMAKFSVKILNDGEVEFLNESLNAESYTWDFGDGKGSTNNNPKYHYIADGTYSVKLKAVNQNGFSEFIQSIKIVDAIDYNDYYITFKGTIFDKPVDYSKYVKYCSLDMYGSDCIFQGGIDDRNARYSYSFAGFTSNENNVFQNLSVATKRIVIDTYNTIKIGEVKFGQSPIDTSGYYIDYFVRTLSSPQAYYYSYSGDQTGSKLNIKSKKIIKSVIGTQNILVKLELKCNMYDVNRKYVGKIEGDMQLIYTNSKQEFK